MEDLATKLKRLAIGSDALIELHTQKLKTLLTRVYDQSPYYKGKFDKAGVNPHQFESLDEFKNYPTFDKYEERESQARPLQELGHPLGMHLTCDIREVNRISASTGTTRVIEMAQHVQRRNRTPERCANLAWPYARFQRHITGALHECPVNPSWRLNSQTRCCVSMRILKEGSRTRF